MKMLKTTMLLTLILCLTINLSFAQKAYMIHQDNVDGVLAGNYGNLVPTDNNCTEENEENLSEEQKRRCNATRSSRTGNATLLPVVEEKNHKEHFGVLREMRNFKKFLVINYIDPAT